MPYASFAPLFSKTLRPSTPILANLGGGAHGHLGMVMSDDTYASIAPIVWIDPEEPPVAPIILIGATGPQISEANRAHAQSLRERREFQNLDRSLLRLVTESIEPLYLKPFHEPYIGLLGKTTKGLLTLLMSTYDYILPQELEHNREKLAMPFDATDDPFQVLIDRFEEARMYARDGNLPISDAQLVNSGIVALKNTGVLERYINLWNDKPEEPRSSWLHFKMHFQSRILEYQKGRRTAISTRFFGLNAKSYYPQIDNQPVASNTIINNSNQMAMANMAATQYELLNQLAEMHEKYAALTASANAASHNTPQGSKKKLPGAKSYCWTHGFRVKSTHNSENCKYPAEGHKKLATKDNRMGGSDNGAT